MLFEDKKRTSSNPMNHVESDYEFLDRSAWPEAKKIRDYLNYWFARYAEEEKKELSARIRSGNKAAFDSAVFELMLFSFYNCLGCSVEVHPVMSNGKRPDFLIATPEGKKFYVEAVLASEQSAEQTGEDKRKAVVFEAIEGIESPNFFLDVRATGSPKTSPSLKSLKKEIQAWLASLDPDQVYREITDGGYQASPKLDFKLDDWQITFRAHPIKPDRRGMGQRTIGAMSGGVGWVTIGENIKKAVRTKGNKYGEPDLPLLIAVNVDGLHLNYRQGREALFGDENVLVNKNAPELGATKNREKNGVWCGQSGPVYTRISGVWLFKNLSPWNMNTHNLLYFNPYAKDALPGFLKQLSHVEGRDGTLVLNEGVSLNKILDHSESWPE